MDLIFCRWLDPEVFVMPMGPTNSATCPILIGIYFYEQTTYGFGT